MNENAKSVWPRIFQILLILVFLGLIGGSAWADSLVVTVVDTYPSGNTVSGAYLTLNRWGGQFLSSWPGDPYPTDSSGITVWPALPPLGSSPAFADLHVESGTTICD